MQRIKTAEEVEKKQRVVKIVAGSVLIFLMVFSTAGFALNGIGGSSDSVEDNEKVYFDGNYWVYSFGSQQFYFKNKLEDTSEIFVQISSRLNDFSQQVLYLDSENEGVLSEISNNLGRYSSRIQEACYGNCERDVPEKDCSENLIVFRESDEQKVTQEDKCIFIDGSLVSVDAFLYKVLGFF